jgi:hypothetical protein
MSVYPLADKYPNISAYAYCAWNPVILVNPDGRDWFLNETSGAVYYNRKIVISNFASPDFRKRKSALVKKSLHLYCSITQKNEGKTEQQKTQVLQVLQRID